MVYIVSLFGKSYPRVHYPRQDRSESEERGFGLGSVRVLVRGYCGSTVLDLLTGERRFTRSIAKH
jgi:hypothetical protein